MSINVVLAALAAAVGSFLAMSPSSIFIVIIVKRFGGGLPAGLMWTTLVNLLIAAGSFFVFIVGEVPYEPWQPLLAIGSALVAALIWNVTAFIVFRR